MSIDPTADQLTSTTLKTIESFNYAINQRDIELTMALMTEKCVFENTYPPPDGERFAGQPSVRRFWMDFFDASPGLHFEFEEIFAYGERAFTRWIYYWPNPDGTTGHVRGVDIFHVTDGKVSEKLSYVKG